MSDQRGDGTFYFDLFSPLAYLAAEQLLREAPGGFDWQPVLARNLGGAETFETFRCQYEVDVFHENVGRRAVELEILPMAWPDPFPFDSRLAMCVATYAKSIGRVVAFAQAAFRQAFAGGRNLADPDFVLVAAAACEMHPRAVLGSAQRASVAQELDRATAAAAAEGVRDVPAVRIGDRVVVGEGALREVALTR